MQSGCSKTLAAMKRKYNAEMALHSIEALRNAIDGVQFTTDFIVGFPTESDEDFETTVEFVKKARFLQTHIFKYSKRKGTVAATMQGQVAEEIKHTRSQRLIAVCSEISKELLREEIRVRPTQKVLFEQITDGYWCGHTASFIEVRVKSDKDLHGAFADVKLLKNCCEYIIGELI